MISCDNVEFQSQTNRRIILCYISISLLIISQIQKSTTGKFLRQHNQRKNDVKKDEQFWFVSFCHFKIINHHFVIRESRVLIRIVDCTDCIGAKCHSVFWYRYCNFLLVSVFVSFCRRCFLLRFGFFSVHLLAFVATKNNFFWLMTRFDVIMSFKEDSSR